MQNDNFSFEKGWSEAKGKYQSKIKAEIKFRLNIKTDAAFYARRRGEVEHRMTEAQIIEEIFIKYKVPKNKIWGRA